MKKVILSSKAPAPIGPYSQAIEANGTLYVSGQIPIDPATGQVVAGGIEPQAKQVMQSLKAILEEAGYTFDQVVKTTILLDDLGNFTKVNEIYGGYFADYLQKTYGMESYSKLWKLSWRLFIPGKFKSIYDKGVSAAWNQFINTIPLPEKLNEPAPFASQIKKSGYSALAASHDGFAYYDFDSQAVYFTHVNIDNTDNTIAASTPVKLFTADFSLNQLSFSEDGSLLVVSDSVETSNKTSQKRSRIFDMKKRRFIGKPIPSSMAACFVDNQTLCSIRLKNQSFSAVLIDRTTQEVKKVLYTAGPGQSFASLYSPCYIGEGQVALIAANGVKRTILRIDTETGRLSSLPEQDTPYAIRYLQSVKSGNEYILAFSWAEMNMLYRLGLYYPKSGIIKTQQTDISGGVFFPILLPEKQQLSNEVGNHSIIYVGQHGTYHRLYTMQESELTVKTIQPTAITVQPDIPASIKLPNLELLNPSRYPPPPGGGGGKGPATSQYPCRYTALRRIRYRDKTGYA